MQQTVLESRKVIANHIKSRMRIQSLWTVLNNWLLLKPRFGLLQCRGKWFCLYFKELNSWDIFYCVDIQKFITTTQYNERPRTIIDNLILDSAVSTVQIIITNGLRATMTLQFLFFLRSHKISLSIYITCVFQYLPSAYIKARLKSRYLILP